MSIRIPPLLSRQRRRLLSRPESRPPGAGRRRRLLSRPQSRPPGAGRRRWLLSRPQSRPPGAGRRRRLLSRPQPRPPGAGNRRRLLSRHRRWLIVVTNDDGIGSPGLLAAVRCVLDLGKVWIVAPRVQQSGSGRSFPAHRVEAQESTLTVEGITVPAVALDTSPAQAVRHGLLRFVPRQPDLVIAGINYGENLGGTITISGTIGAAIEAASFGVPTLAASLETETQYHFGQSTEVDFTTAAVFVRRFAQWMLTHSLPSGVDILKLDVPSAARPDTPWRITRVSRQSYWVSPVAVDEQGKKHLRGYVRHIDLDKLEPDSDVHAIAVDKVVSLSPLTIDLTANVNLSELEHTLSP